MRNVFGENVTVTLFGESHGEEIGVVIDGLAPGIKINRDSINKALELRRPSGKISTSRVEKDEYRIVSGVFNDYTTGSALTILIPNVNTVSKDYSELKIKPRPSHADYVAEVKYGGYQDYRGGGHFSGRITAPLVAAGAIASDILKAHNIYVGSHIKNIKGILDSDFNGTKEELLELNNKKFALINSSLEEKMNKVIEKAKDNLDSVGGIIETEVLGLPVGIGEPFFDSIESNLSKVLFSVPAVKGVEFGEGFNFANLYGSEANDEFKYEGEKIVTSTNHNGGINGGISNGMPLVFRSVIKPTPSISKIQNTVDLSKKENCELEIKGRHDPCIVHRARIVIDSLVALTLLDLISTANSNNWMK